MSASYSVKLVNQLEKVNKFSTFEIVALILLWVKLCIDIFFPGVLAIIPCSVTIAVCAVVLLLLIRRTIKSMVLRMILDLHKD